MFTEILSKLKTLFGSNPSKIYVTDHIDQPRNCAVYSGVYELPKDFFVRILINSSIYVDLKVQTSDEIFAHFDKVLSSNLQTMKHTASVAVPNVSYGIFSGTKPLSRNRIHLSEYGLKMGQSLTMVQYIVKGGSQDNIETYNTTTNLYSYNVFLENQLLERPKQIKNLKIENLKIQSSDSEINFDRMINFIMQNSQILNRLENFGPDGQWIISHIENFIQIIIWFQKCETYTDFVSLMCLAYKLFTGKSSTLLIKDKLRNLFEFELQSSDFSDTLKKCREAFTTAETIIDNPLIKKITSLYTFLLVQGFLVKFGFKLNDDEYSRMEQRALILNYSSRKALVMNILDTTLFICERYQEWMDTGDFCSFTHSEAEYSKWAKEADRVLALAPFTSNLSAHNTSYFSYLSDLNDCVEKGEAYVKFTSKTSSFEATALKKKLYSLQLLKNTEITKRASQKERKSPFGVLVHGTSSVAKSTFSKMLFYYYGSLFDLEKDDHFRYVRNPADEYWSNYDSSKWCIQMDDIAFLLPSAASEADPTLMEMLNVVNNVPYVPPQAALEDKGKTPVMARLVVATSNAENLNAADYFWCPLAVRRRLGYVVHVEPKEEFIHENGRFINSAKLGPVGDVFPDWWKITVKEIVPVFDGQRDRATLEIRKEFDNIDDFLADFGQYAMKHEATQERAMHCDGEMRDITICKSCYRNSKNCNCSMKIQSLDEFSWIKFNRDTIFQRMSCSFLECYLWIIQLSFIMNMLLWACRYKFIRRYAMKYCISRLSSETQIATIGRINSQIYNNLKTKYIVGFLSIVCSVVGIYLYTKKTNKNKSNEDIMESQVNTYSNAELQFKKEDTRNVWYNPTIELTTFDVPVPSASMCNYTKEDLTERFSKNVVRLLIHYKDDVGTARVRSLCGIYVRSHYILTNNHAFVNGCSEYIVEIISSSTIQGLNSNVKITFKESDIIRAPEHELCLFETRTLPPRKDILKHWATHLNIPMSLCISIRREENGLLEIQNVYKPERALNFAVAELGIKRTCFIGTTERNTVNGDCGSLTFNPSPRGPIIFGLHTLGRDNINGIMGVVQSEILSLITKHDALFTPLMEIQGCGQPMLDLEAKCNRLTLPHHRSMFRYLPEGSLNIYGSLVMNRTMPKSNVCATVLSEEMCDHFQCKVEHGPPVMSGWNPWKNNIVEMIKPNATYDRSILNACVKSFTDDITSLLPKNWENEMCFLSKYASVNGIPGVKFIDSVNKNTSMGFPWCTTKKKFMIASPQGDNLDGVDFQPEVWSRYDKIAQLYSEGKRAFPVFVGTLKDEPTAFAKIAKEKTRVFTGAPIDWSLIVRSRLLPFIKLLQTNKYIFEAGPGTVCQSMEWTCIYKYLTVHGEDRIIAGDYGKFDKRMIADFILAAYTIIANVYRKSGKFTEDQIREIMCIAEDTAFPVVNMNGDLVEFFGTNPSGHPLTVVINSLVNSLYMRYCYCKLNPKSEVRSFKKNVNLFTYGDDNIMGVSRDCDWFNHTGIQAILADIGVEYTMADKESQSVPFINIKDCQFLKRTWRFDEDVGAYLCPLELASIKKSLTVWCPSKSIEKEEQMVAVISSANMEFFYYGKEIFQYHHDYFKMILQREPFSHYVHNSTLPNWEELHLRFKEASKIR